MLFCYMFKNATKIMREELKQKLVELAEEFCDGPFDPQTVLSTLQCKGVISHHEVELVEEKKMIQGRLAKLLLEILPCKDDKAFDVFVKILDDRKIHSEVLQLHTCPADPNHAFVRRAAFKKCGKSAKPDNLTAAFSANEEKEADHEYHQDDESAAGVKCPSHSLYRKVSLETREHPLFDEINAVVQTQLRYTKMPVEEEGGWRLFNEEGDMKLYRKSVKDSVWCGLTVDPLKATFTVKGVTAQEFCHYFYEPNYRSHWDVTVEKIIALKRIAEDTLICHQLHVGVTGLGFFNIRPRESLVWAHIRRVDTEKDADARNLYIVCNHSTTCSDMPEQRGYVRVGANVAMMCQTFIDPLAVSKTSSELKREDFICKVVYFAQISPGGWIRDDVANAVFESQFPKVLKQFKRYVLHQTSGCKEDFQIKAKDEKEWWQCNIL